MSDLSVIGVDPVNGRSKLTYVDHSGPTSYVTGGEKWPQQSVFGGPNAVGLSDINWVNGGFTEDGLYLVVPIFGGNGALKGTITLIWYTVASLATGVAAQPTAGTPLNASKIRLCVLGG
jgi:hypothetical protein